MHVRLLLVALVLICAAACDRAPEAGILPGALPYPPDPPAGAQMRLQPEELPAGQKALRLGVTPYTTRADLWAAMHPVATAIGERLGLSIELVEAASYHDLIQRFAAGEVDLALLSPLSYVTARQRMADLHLLARTLSSGAAEYSAYVVVRADDPAKTLADLRGRRIAWVDPLSTAGYLFPYAALLAHGLDPERDLGGSVMAGTHEAAIHAVVSGQVDAAAVSSDALARGTAGSEWAGVRILHRAGRIPFDALCARPGLSKSAVTKIAWAFQGLNTRTTEGLRALAPSRHLTGWIPAEDSAYDGIRAVVRAVERKVAPDLGGPDAR